MSRCRFGYPERPGGKIVFFCDDEATGTFTQLVPNSGGCTVNVLVCDAHAEHLVFLAREERLRTQGVTRTPLIFPTADSVPTYLSGRLVTRSGVTYGRHHPTNEVWWRVGDDGTLTDEFVVLHRLPAEEWPLTEASASGTSIITVESIGTWCERCRANVTGSHYHCAKCGQRSSMLGHRMFSCTAADAEVETFDVFTVGGEHVRTVTREIEHSHTEESCGHSVYDLEMEGATSCSHCGEYYRNTEWCPHRCQVTHDEIVASIVRAERDGLFPPHADETRLGGETPD